MTESTPASIATTSKPSPALPRWMSWGSVIALALAMYLIRITAPADLADDYHQERAAAYVQDALLNGHWICQYGAYGEVSSKPPMLTWLAALASLPAGRPTWFSLTLPVALATTAIAVLLYAAGTRMFGPAGGFFAALVYLMSMICARQIVQARIDGLFTLTVLVTALLGFECWRRGRGWTWFWIAAAVATLTKGPLGVLLGGIGLIAWWWEKRGGATTSLRGSHIGGVLIFVAIVGGWFALAYRAIGQPLVDVMLGRELVGHAVHSAGAIPGRYFYLPTLVFLSRFAPWSVFTAIGLWRAFKQPAADEWQRRFERFVVCSFLGGLFVFSLAPHQRPDLLFPIIPFAALIAGRELSRWIGTRRYLPATGVAIAVALLALGGTAFKYHYSYAKNVKVIRTAGLRELANTVRASGGEKFPLIHVDSPFAFQVYLNTKTPMVPLAEAARLLRGANAVFVAVADLAALERAVGQGRKLHQLAAWKGGGKEQLHIVSNQPRLERTPDTVEPRKQSGPTRGGFDDE